MSNLRGNNVNFVYYDEYDLNSLDNKLAMIKIKIKLFFKNLFKRGGNK